MRLPGCCARKEAGAAVPGRTAFPRKYDGEYNDDAASINSVTFDVAADGTIFMVYDFP